MKKLFVALMVILAMTSCNSFKIKVNLDNSNGKTVSLQRYNKDQLETLQTVVVKNNKAVFKVKENDNLDAYIIMLNGWRRPLTFFADNQDVMISGDCQKYNEIKIEASESQQNLDNFMKKAAEIENDEDLYYFVLDFAKYNVENPLGIYVMYRYKWLFPEYDLKMYLGNVPKELVSGYKDLVYNYLLAVRRTNPGQKYIDFTQKTVDGDDFTLSQFIGQAKVVILDFWASWCPDCRKANPALVEVYKKFNNKGLDIVSVSLDTDATAWKNAIEKDNLNWKNHVSDLKGWDNAVAQKYTIVFIPQNIIIDQDGKIIEKNVPMEKMEAYIESVLK